MANQSHVKPHLVPLHQYFKVESNFFSDELMENSLLSQKDIKIDLSGNNYREIKFESSALLNLKILILDRNRIKLLPNLKTLVNIEYFSAQDNKIEKIPQSFFSLEKLTIIKFDRNRIANVKEEFGNFPKLKMLGMAENPFSEFPVSFAFSKSLEELTLGWELFFTDHGVLFDKPISGNKMKEFKEICLKLQQNGYKFIDFATFILNLFPNSIVLNEYNVKKFNLPHHCVLKCTFAPLKFLVEQYSSIKDQIDKDGFTAFSKALILNKKFIREFLVKSGCDIIKGGGIYGTLVHFAIWNNNMKILKYLLLHKANLNVVNFEKKTALHEAILLLEKVPGMNHFVFCLLNGGADPNAKTIEGYTALHIAAKMNSKEILHFLITQCKNLKCNGRGGNLKWTPMHFAALHGVFEIVELLSGKCSLMRTDINGRRPKFISLNSLCLHKLYTKLEKREINYKKKEIIMGCDFQIMDFQALINKTMSVKKKFHGKSTQMKYFELKCVERGPVFKPEINSNFEDFLRCRGKEDNEVIDYDFLEKPSGIAKQKMNAQMIEANDEFCCLRDSESNEHESLMINQIKAMNISSRGVFSKEKKSEEKNQSFFAFEDCEQDFEFGELGSNFLDLNLLRILLCDSNKSPQIRLHTLLIVSASLYRFQNIFSSFASFHIPKSIHIINDFPDSHIKYGNSNLLVGEDSSFIIKTIVLNILESLSQSSTPQNLNFLLILFRIATLNTFDSEFYSKLNTQLDSNNYLNNSFLLKYEILDSKLKIFHYARNSSTFKFNLQRKIEDVRKNLFRTRNINEVSEEFFNKKAKFQTIYNLKSHSSLENVKARTFVLSPENFYDNEDVFINDKNRNYTNFLKKRFIKANRREILSYKKDLIE